MIWSNEIFQEKVNRKITKQLVKTLNSSIRPSPSGDTGPFTTPRSTDVLSAVVKEESHKFVNTHEVKTSS